MPELLTLKNEILELIISPSVGGSIFSLKYNMDGSWVDIMRPTPEISLDKSIPGDFSSFNLIPYSNILENGELHFHDKVYKLYSDNPSEHRPHGEARYKPFNVVEYTGAKILLGFSSDDFNDLYWPFPFSSRVRYSLEQNSFKADFELKNTGSEDMPAGFGLHPYFVRDLGSIIQDVSIKIPLEGIYPGDDQFPSGKWIKSSMADKYNNGAILDRSHLDKCYKVAPGQWNILWKQSNLRLVIENSDAFGHLVIYCPEDNDAFFAVEPLTHCNNAYNLHEAGTEDTGTIILKPGQTFKGSSKFTII